MTPGLLHSNKGEYQHQTFKKKVCLETFELKGTALY